jgi:hypothetical protein
MQGRLSGWPTCLACFSVAVFSGILSLRLSSVKTELDAISFASFSLLRKAGWLMFVGDERYLTFRSINRNDI